MVRKKLLAAMIIVLFPATMQCQVWEEHDYFKTTYIQTLMKKVTDWQMNHLVFESGGGYGNMGRVKDNGWIRGTLYLGVMATYQTPGDRKYLDHCYQFAERNNWQLGPNIRHADDQTVGQVYLELYKLQQNDKYIQSLQQNLDSMYYFPQRGPTHGWDKNKNWSWSDALFMAPPSIACLYNITKDKKYLELLDMYYWDTYNLLFDKEEKLFYRDERYLFSKKGKAKTKNGQKVLWLRGNAWVLGGLARILQYLPKSYDNYERYLDLYRQMAGRLLELQQIDGLWRPSLLDPWQFPEKETSGSSFICFALAWGINEGILDETTYKNPVKRAWLALTECVDENGRLGWVQPVGHDPQHIKSTDTMEYGIGAFLLAAREIYKMSFIENVNKRYSEDSIY